jgi:hypothetical protein
MLLELKMPETDPMTINERRKYIYKMWERYRKGKRKEKGKLLDEMEKVCGLHRKSLIRILNGRLSRKKRVKERGKSYGIEVANAVGVIAHSLDYPCAERLKPNLGWMARHLVRHGEMTIDPETMEKLETISTSTLKRMMKKGSRRSEKLAYRKPQRTVRNHLRQAYPMRRIPWDLPEPGHFEVDLVTHCGEEATGDFVHTIQLVDVATGWSEIEAVFGRSYKAMRDGFDTILKRLPFPILELHPDNGSEFFNHHLLRFWNSRIVSLQLSRSRPYHKNDNRFVEENNHSLIRAYVGHSRLDTVQQLGHLRRLYDLLWQYHNLFQPVLRTRAKDFSDPLRYRRVFDAARPPLDRLFDANVLSPYQRMFLSDLRDRINPVLLRNQIESQITLVHEPNTCNTPYVVNVLTTLRKESESSVILSFDLSNTVQ